MSEIVSLNKISLSDILLVGGKVASLGEMIQNLKTKNVNIPGGFCVTASAYREFLKHNQLEKKILDQLASFSVDDIGMLQKKAKKIRRWILAGELPQDLQAKIKKAFNALKNNGPVRVAVRSSATCEDLPNASFAGLHDTILHVTKQADLFSAIKKVFASMYNERAIAYRSHHHFSENGVAMAVGVQVMVHSDNAISGVMFTIDTESGFDKIVMISASYGLGESIVSGQVTPDEFTLYKPNVNTKKQAILRRQLGDKKIKIIYKNKKLAKVIISSKQQQQFCLTDKQANELARQALIVEDHYGKPMDIEWAQDSRTKKLFLVQARPETVESQKSQTVLTTYHFTKKGKLLCQGRCVGRSIGVGCAKVIMSLNEMKNFQPGDVLVTDITNPDWEPIMKHASAIVTNRGGRTCHAAIIARELGIPAVVGTRDATKKIASGSQVSVSCSEGNEGFIYSGIAEYTTHEHILNDLPKAPVKLTMNLGNPDQAFRCQAMPSEGVGLARLEFIISNMIGVHPRACIEYRKLPLKIKRLVELKTSAYESPKEFYIERLREGMSMIAAAFYPRDVIFRFSDFKSNEYANLLGGQLFEPHEENPMLGYRGAARYVSDAFKPCFSLECEAIKRVREDMGLTNAHVMIPFARTVNEVNQVLKNMREFGLVRGRGGLKVYLMCEIPSNVILAEEFLENVDGFSIGSNDLTQLTLGLDRDSELVSSLFDERDAAVKTLLSTVIAICLKQKKYVGICGQAPSDYPDFAEWLVKQKITSISLSPDSVVNTLIYLSKKQS